MSDGRIPLTVLGGYLGAGKTTVLNALLRDPGGRRLGVIVNDFGALAVDVALLSGSADGDDVVSLPNGCVCCTLGSDLRGALAALTERPHPPDHIVVEASGVADPTSAAAWGTVAPFEPGGVIVLADATAVRRRAADRYVGGEVVRQLAGADLIVVSKVDLTTPEELGSTSAWLDGAAPGVPRLVAVHGDIPADVILGMRPATVRAGDAAGDGGRAGGSHDDRYARWAWSSSDPVGRDALRSFLDELRGDVLRAKGIVLVDHDEAVVLDVVGRRRTLSKWTAPRPSTSALVVIGLQGSLDTAHLDAAAADLLGGR